MRTVRVSLCVLVFALAAGVASAADPNFPTGNAGIIAVAKRGAKIEFYDPKSYALLAALPVPENPHEVAISPDHMRAYISIYGPRIYGDNPMPDHRIEVVDLAQRKIVDEIDTVPYRPPHGIMVGPDGLLYVTCDADRKLLVIDPATHAIKAAIDTEGTGHWVAIMPDASKAYISNKEDKPLIGVIDLNASKLIARIPSPNGTERIAVSPDGRRLVAAEHFRAWLLEVDTATDKVIAEVPLAGYLLSQPDLNHQVRVRFTPDGKYVLTSYFITGLVTVLDAHDLTKQVLGPATKGPMGFALAPDGQPCSSPARIGTPSRCSISRLRRITCATSRPTAASKR